MERLVYRWMGVPVVLPVLFVLGFAQAEDSGRERTSAAASPDGRWTATADHRPGAKTGRVVLLDADGTEVSSAEVPGDVRSLQFSPESDRLFLLSGRPLKRAPDEVHLWISPLPNLAFKRRTRLAGGSTALSFWTDERAILIASPDQIRTLFREGSRSGPLFPVPGDNRAIAVLAEGRLLIGQDTSVKMVNLNQPPGRESMPILESWPLPAPARSIQIAADESVAEVLLVDGSTRTVDLPTAVPHPPKPVSTPREAPKAEAPAVPVAEARPPSPVEEAVPALDPIPEKTAPPQEPIPEEIAPAEPEPQPLDRKPASANSIEGTIEGALDGHRVFITVLGPDNLLREAARVPVGEDGRFRIDGLAPGRYRVQPAADAGAALVAEPRFGTVEIREGAAGHRLTFRIVRFL